MDTERVFRIFLKWLSDCLEPLHGNDHQPQHGHGDGDLLKRVSEVGNHSVEPILTAHADMTNQDIVKEEHDDQEGVNKGQNSEVRLEPAEK